MRGSMTYCIPAYCADDGLLDTVHLGPVTQELRLVHLCELLVLHFLDVGTGSESFLGSSQDDCADAVVCVNLGHSIVELMEELGVEGIQLNIVE